MDNLIFRSRVSDIFAEETHLQNEMAMANRHIHEGTELYFLLDGERYYTIEQDTYLIKSHTAVMIHPNQMHMTYGTGNSQGYHRFLLQLEPTIMDRFHALSGAPSKHIFKNNYWGIVEFAPAEWAHILSLIDMLKKEMAIKTPESSSIAQLLVLQILMLFVRTRRQNAISSTPDIKENNQGANYQIVHEIAIYLQNHSSQKCSLDEIATLFYISRSKLTRIFKAITSYTITEYVTLCRIQKAKALLDDTSLGISDIALQTGFGNITYFERIFKKTTGMTPVQYRKWNL